MNEKGVSPVIGVILMVAITVILAAVIASFVFGMGQKAVTTAPSMSLEVKVDPDIAGGDDVVITHLGGDAVDPSDLEAVAKRGSTVKVDKSLNTYVKEISNDGLFGVGEIIRSDTNPISNTGTWEVTIIHKPTNTVIWKGTVTRGS